jgi:uracil-DNA glycosylase
MEIFIIGDRPSNKNKHQDIPFVGTQSYKKLLEWIYRMDIDVSNVKLINMFNIDGSLNKTSSRMIQYIIGMGDNSKKMIFLGNKSIKGLNQILKNESDFFKSRRVNINSFFILPHPSPKNRVLNDKKFEKDILEKCKKWLKD